jgi:DNA-binding NtrC family response regulator
VSQAIPYSDAIPVQVRELLDLYQDPAILLSHDYRILAANPAYCRLYGEGEPLAQRHCYEVSHHYSVPCDQAGESCPLKDSLASGQPERVLHVHHTPRGDEHVDVETHPIRDEQGNITYFMEVMRQSRVASASPSERGLVGRSPAFNHMLELIQRAAPSETTVLLLGETGTGKELVAQAVHEQSGRRDGPFVPVECSGLTETLFESELFGHEKGAFTGANSRKIGLVESARGGTLFLDEVGDIPLAMQVKLLRLLETGTYRRVGGVEALQADFRLVCATHRGLKDMVADGSFRADLFYRISSFPVELPALRERRVDLPLLIETVLQRVAPERTLQLDAGALACLRRYRFPGNVRELRNMLERASLLADGDTIGARHLPEDCQCDGPAETESTPLCADGDIIPLDELEQRYLQQISARFRGDRKELAARLGISERTLYRKLRSPT